MNKLTSNELTNYLNQGVENIISDIFKHSIKNSREVAFLLKFHNQSKKLQKIRLEFEKNCKHIPAFLISSITETCNLYCKGCYARSNGICGDSNEETMLSAKEWAKIFKQASNLGISFNLLAGGEPLMRRDVIIEATKFKNIVFPVFSNGTMIDEEYLELFDKNRNLVPVLSIEGNENTTDERRGAGIYNLVLSKMDEFHNKDILFGVSITVTKENFHEVTSKEFIKELKNKSCKVVFFIEYVPVNENTSHLAFSEKERVEFEKITLQLKKDIIDILFISFPGDEKNMGGCLAAGRGFFHINPYGAAEPCPFSPYSDCSLKDTTLLNALESPLFKKLQDDGLVGSEHKGGCALFEQKEKVMAML